jgi:hypothetical protein
MIAARRRREQPLFCDLEIYSNSQAARGGRRTARARRVRTQGDEDQVIEDAGQAFVNPPRGDR